MKVKISKDYDMWETLLKNDIRSKNIYGHYHKATAPSEYHRWETVDVDFDELKELIKKGTAIMINC